MRKVLTPMLVQYLVGLCCLKWDANAVEVTLGDMVLDPNADKERDVDVTVLVNENKDLLHAFKAYEVKNEKAPLDVAVVEQLCAKLLDMPAITSRAIVSSSGYTKAAQKKAASKGVQLYQLVEWKRPLREQFPSFPQETLPQKFLRFSTTRLCWEQLQLDLLVPNGPESFSILPTDGIFDKKGKPHKAFSTFGYLKNALALRSTEVLYKLEPASTVFRTFDMQQMEENPDISIGPPWRHTHSLEVKEDAIYLSTGDSLSQLTMVHLNGFLQWQKVDEKPLYYVVESVPNGEALAGALVAMGAREGTMTGILMSPKSREMSIHFVKLRENQLNAIRKLKLELPKNEDSQAQQAKDVIRMSYSSAS